MKRGRRSCAALDIPVLEKNTTPQDSERVLVAVRVRPLSEKEIENGAQECVECTTNNTLVIRRKAQPKAVLKSQQEQVNDYCYDQVFGPKSTQEEVYREAAATHIPSVLEGINVTVIAYGATGAGKTHTMMGSTRSVNGSTEAEDGGIIPMALQDIFDGIEKAKVSQGRNDTPGHIDSKWSVHISYCEVYNEMVFDLLSDRSTAPPAGLRVLEDATQGVVTVQGLSELEAQNPIKVLDLLIAGNDNRTTESTAANSVSSRSHAILWVAVREEWKDEVTGGLRRREAKLSLIDLAGSERASATQNAGVRLQEGAKINRSLLALANCINKLAIQDAYNEKEGKKKKQTVRRGSTGSVPGSVVNYRDSKLTHLLKSSLEGQCRMIMIANINPNDGVYEESHNTLKYANRAKEIKVKAEVRETIGEKAEKAAAAALFAKEKKEAKEAEKAAAAALLAKEKKEAKEAKEAQKAAAAALLAKEKKEAKEAKEAEKAAAAILATAASSSDTEARKLSKSSSSSSGMSKYPVWVTGNKKETPAQKLQAAKDAAALKSKLSAEAKMAKQREKEEAARRDSSSSFETDETRKLEEEIRVLKAQYEAQQLRVGSASHNDTDDYVAPHSSQVIHEKNSIASSSTHQSSEEFNDDNYIPAVVFQRQDVDSAYIAPSASQVLEGNERESSVSRMRDEDELSMDDFTVCTMDTAIPPPCRAPPPPPPRNVTSSFLAPPPPPRDSSISDSMKQANKLNSVETTKSLEPSPEDVANMLSKAQQAQSQLSSLLRGAQTELTQTRYDLSESRAEVSSLKSITESLKRKVEELEKSHLDDRERAVRAEAKVEELEQRVRSLLEAGFEKVNQMEEQVDLVSNTTQPKPTASAPSSVSSATASSSTKKRDRKKSELNCAVSMNPLLNEDDDRFTKFENVPACAVVSNSKLKGDGCNGPATHAFLKSKRWTRSSAKSIKEDEPVLPDAKKIKSSR